MVSMLKLHSPLHMKLIHQSWMIYAQLLIICERTLHSYYLLLINQQEAILACDQYGTYLMGDTLPDRHDRESKMHLVPTYTSWT